MYTECTMHIHIQGAQNLWNIITYMKYIGYCDVFCPTPCMYINTIWMSMYIQGQVQHIDKHIYILYVIANINEYNKVIRFMANTCVSNKYIFKMGFYFLHIIILVWDSTRRASSSWHMVYIDICNYLTVIVRIRF